MKLILVRDDVFELLRAERKPGETVGQVLVRLFDLPTHKGNRPPQYRQPTSQRIKAGLARARANGKELGRPSYPRPLREALRNAAAALGRRTAAERFGVSLSTIKRILRGE